MIDHGLNSAVIAASSLGWAPPVVEADWPEAFDREGKTWKKAHMVVAQRIHEVQCVSYTAGFGQWLVVTNE